MEREIHPKTERGLAERAASSVDPGLPIAIKRDVHEFVVECGAAELVEMLSDVLVDANGTFGIIRVKRPRGRLGERFEVGERFQGSFSLERALRAVAARRGGVASTLVERLFAVPATTRVVTWLEDRLLSNYAEIERIELEPDEASGGAYLLSYRYLDGTPIAGTNTYTIEAIGEARCRVRQIFEYQEVNAMALATFQRFGLKFHDQVVHSQVAQAAARLGVSFRGTVPEPYTTLLVDAALGATEVRQ